IPDHLLPFPHVREPIYQTDGKEGPIFEDLEPGPGRPTPTHRMTRPTCATEHRPPSGSSSRPRRTPCPRRCGDRSPLPSSGSSVGPKGVVSGLGTSKTTRIPGRSGVGGSAVRLSPGGTVGHVPVPLLRPYRSCKNPYPFSPQTQTHSGS